MYWTPTVTGLSKGSPVLPSYRIDFPSTDNPVSFNNCSISSWFAPSNTGVAIFHPFSLATIPKWTSKICPKFIREGTPNGFNKISIGVPSGINGISSTGKILETTPLFPWRPAILSPTEIFLFVAIYTLITWFTPGANSSEFSLVKLFTSTIVPASPCGTLNDVSLTSLAFSPKIALNNLSSAVSSVSPFGVTLPTNISPVLTSAPILIIPFSSKSFNWSSPTFGISRVISSGPNFVSRHSQSYSSIWIDVNTSSLTSLSLNKTASS